MITLSSISGLNLQRQNVDYSGEMVSFRVPPDPIFIVDQAVENYLRIVSQASLNATVYMINGDRDGIYQITEILKNHRYIPALHIISPHAAIGWQIGGTIVNSHNLQQYQSQLQQWSSALSTNADILIDGGNLEGDRHFSQNLSKMIGLPVKIGKIDLSVKMLNLISPYKLYTETWQTTSLQGCLEMSH